MRKFSHLFIFILVNILIAAITTLTVLWLWERAHPRPEVSQIGNASETTVDLTQEVLHEDISPVVSEMDLANENIQINIRTIVGAGNLAVEYVEIVNQGQNPADLTDWKLIDEEGQQFTFPALILNSGGAIKVLSKTGTNTVIELYWQRDSPVWQPGETAHLLNPADEIITSYLIP